MMERRNEDTAREGLSMKDMSRRSFVGLGALAGLGMATGLAGCAPQSATSASPDASSSASMDWLGVEPEVAESEITATEETDFLIIGAGTAGLPAAATAADLGLDFIICDGSSTVPETREYLGAVNSRFGLAAGPAVDKGRLLNELTRYASGKVDQEVIKVWIDESAEMIDWIDPMMTAAGKTVVVDVPGEHQTGGTGYYLPVLQHVYLTPYSEPMRNNILQEHIEASGNQIRFQHELVKLEHGDGKVTGAIFRTSDGYKRITAKDTLLATGGYAANPVMVQALQPNVGACCTAASYNPTCVGTGIKAGLWAGAVKDVEPAPMIFDRGAVLPGVSAGYNGTGDGATLPGTIFQLNIGSQPFLKVDRAGERFANESTPYDFICFQAAQHEGGVWCQVFDGNASSDILRFSTIGCSAFSNQMMATGMPIDDFIAMDGGSDVVMKADTLDELADKLGFEGDAKKTFLATCAHYNELFDAQEDTDFGKEAYRLSALRTPPFYGTWFGGTLLTTIDGLRINANMQVLDADGGVIEGLYAAGDCSGSFFSGNYPEYIVGCASGRSTTQGRHVAKYLASR